MKKLYVLVTALIFGAQISQVSAKNLVRVKAIGSSPRGQYVAFEEFGYKDASRKVPYSKIRIMNVWKNQFVGRTVKVIGQDQEARLNIVRTRAKDQASASLKKFNIAI